MVQPGDFLTDAETVARSAIYPKIFPDGDPANGFAPEQLLDFQKVERKDKRRVWTSVAWHRILGNDEAQIHAYGCRLAQKKNVGFEARKSIAPTPMINKCHYLGYYDLSMAFLSNVDTEAHRVTVQYAPEEGEESHCNMYILQRDDAPEDSDIRDSRSTLISRLWRSLTGPVRQICDADLKYADELLAIQLPSPT